MIEVKNNFCLENEHNIVQFWSCDYLSMFRLGGVVSDQHDRLDYWVVARSKALSHSITSVPQNPIHGSVLLAVKCHQWVETRFIFRRGILRLMLFLLAAVSTDLSICCKSRHQDHRWPCSKYLRAAASKGACLIEPPSAV